VNPCRQFRTRLASLLSGRASSASFGALSWHEHLLACGACRDLLEAEEALEVLLASLPEPHLPPELAQRLLARLEPTRADFELDALLESSLVAPVPQELGGNVLAKLAGARRAQREERALNTVLDRLPEPAAPRQLVPRLLAALEKARDRERRRQIVPAPPRATGRWTGAEPQETTPLRARSTAPTLRRVLIAASILTAAGATAWVWSTRGSTVTPTEIAIDAPLLTVPEDAAVVEPAPRVALNDVERRALPAQPEPTPGPGPERTARTLDEPPDELLASLDLLESWDILTDDSVEADVNAFDVFDELLLGFDTEEESAR